MIQTRWWLPAMVAGSLMVGCGDNTGGNGVVPQPDGGSTDVDMSMDVQPVDAQMPMDSTQMLGDATTDRPADRPADGATDRPADRPHDAPAMSGTCANPTEVTGTPGADGAIHVMGNNEAAEAEQVGNLGLRGAMGGCLGTTMGGMGAKGSAVVYRYTMRAAGILTVSTANDGTSPDLDSVIAVLSACSATATPLACNDDAGDALQSTVSTPALTAGQVVFIAVGGWGADPSMASTGDFELTLREGVPGTANNPCRTTAPFCDASLACTVAAPTAMANGTCRTPVAAGMPCTAADVCVSGATCIASSATAATCIVDGTTGGHCRLAAPFCDTGFSCTVAMPTATTGLCRTTAALGADCDTARVMNTCVTGSSCRLAPTAMSLTHTACAADGARGGLCRTAVPRCDTGFECSTATTNPTCLAPAAAGAACDLTGTSTYCAMGSSCAPNAMLNGGTCQVNGAAAGTPCRAASPRCDTGFECSAASGAGFCRRSVPTGMACDTRFNSTVCAMGGVCSAATGAVAGACVGVTAEMEPNNTPATGNGPSTTPTTIFSAALPSMDIDCFRVTVPANATITAFTGDASGGCTLGTGADTLMTLYGPTGTMVANNDDAESEDRGLCSEIDPMTEGDTRLPAGTYALCVTGYAAAMGPVAIPNYYLTVRINPAAP